MVGMAIKGQRKITPHSLLKTSISSLSLFFYFFSSLKKKQNKTKKNPLNFFWIFSFLFPFHDVCARLGTLQSTVFLSDGTWPTLYINSCIVTQTERPYSWWMCVFFWFTLLWRFGKGGCLQPLSGCIKGPFKTAVIQWFLASRTVTCWDVGAIVIIGKHC